ncbi:LOW QUALITY PROTEIN: beta-crystallin A2 [Trichechus inunguis]
MGRRGRCAAPRGDPAPIRPHPPCLALPAAPGLPCRFRVIRASRLHRAAERAVRLLLPFLSDCEAQYEGDVFGYVRILREQVSWASGYWQCGAALRRVLVTASIRLQRGQRKLPKSSAGGRGPTPACLTLWDGEDFQGRHCRLLNTCANISERSGLRRVRSVKVESGAWVGFEYPDFQGQQFIMEKGDYPPWSAWSGSSGLHSDPLLSFQPVLCANHSDSRVTLFEGENFQGCRFELSDDYPSLSAMGWASKDVGSLKVSSGAETYSPPCAYRGIPVCLGYRGYQYVLERDWHSGEFRTYRKFGTQVHTRQLQSIQRVQH